jgi:alginate O-acetyltransferase complex protein AlgF
MTRKTTLLSALLAVSVLASPIAAFAQDDGLYDAPVDPNSAFVRVLAPAASIAVVNGTSLDQLTDGLSPYVNVQPGDIAVSAGEADGTVKAAPGGYYTYAFDADGKPTLLTDQAANDPSKAIVYFYNFSDKPTVDLFVPSAKVNAIEAIPTNGTKSVALKAPLKLDVEVMADGASIAKVAGLDLKRRGGVSVIFWGTEGAYSAAAVQNAFYRAD